MVSPVGVEMVTGNAGDPYELLPDPTRPLLEIDKLLDDAGGPVCGMQWRAQHDALDERVDDLVVGLSGFRVLEEVDDLFANRLRRDDGERAKRAALGSS